MVSKKSTGFLMNQFKHVTLAPPDPILSATARFNAATNPQKVNLGIGAYRGSDGKPYVLDVVRIAEKQILENKDLNKEYLPIQGDEEFLHGARGSLFGFGSAMSTDKRVASLQCPSGTAALRLVGDFIAKFRPAPLYMSAETWPTHSKIFTAVGLAQRPYRYFDMTTKGLDIDGMVADLEGAVPGSAVLFHSCAHNPTGVDPSKEHWQQIADACRKNNLFPVFDNTYQGLTSGDFDADAFGPRLFAEMGFEMIIAQSFAKNMGLYGERVGAIHIVCADEETAVNVMSQTKVIVRTCYSSPPLHGARIAAIILNSEENRTLWLKEVNMMRDRLNEMRASLRKALEDKGAPGDWSHITTH
jgi:aspartate aminotransferase, cytoplasmic